MFLDFVWSQSYMITGSAKNYLVWTYTCLSKSKFLFVKIKSDWMFWRYVIQHQSYNEVTPSIHSVFESSVRTSIKVELNFWSLLSKKNWQPAFDNLCPVAPGSTCPAQFHRSITNRFWQCWGWSNHSWCRGSTATTTTTTTTTLPPQLAPVPSWLQGLLDMNWLICE